MSEQSTLRRVLKPQEWRKWAAETAVKKNKDKSTILSQIFAGRKNLRDAQESLHAQQTRSEIQEQDERKKQLKNSYIRELGLQLNPEPDSSAERDNNADYFFPAGFSVKDLNLIDPDRLQTITDIVTFVAGQTERENLYIGLGANKLVKHEEKVTLFGKDVGLKLEVGRHYSGADYEPHTNSLAFSVELQFPADMSAKDFMHSHAQEMSKVIGKAEFLFMIPQVSSEVLGKGEYHVQADTELTAPAYRANLYVETNSDKNNISLTFSLASMSGVDKARINVFTKKAMTLTTSFFQNLQK